MKLPRIMLYALVGACAGLAIPVIAYLKIHFSPAQSAQEKEIIGFASTPLSLHVRGYTEVKRSCPVSSAPVTTQIKPGPITGQQLNIIKTASGERLPRISFILQGNSTPMAVINGFVLKEGNSFDGWHVLRIEQKRVLIENRKVKKWISID